MRALSPVLALALVTGSIAACGGSTAVNFYDGNAGSAGSIVSSGAGVAGSFASAGQPASGAGNGVAGANAVGASAGGDSASSAGSAQGDTIDTPCSPVIDGVGGMTGPFGSTGPYCLRVSGNIVGWGCSNFQGRTLKVNGVAVTCAQLPLPDKLNGDYFFDVSAGDVTYASLFWY